MIRYIDLTGQLTLEDDEFHFAWYDTITDKFLEFADQQTFISWADFLEAFGEHLRDDNPTHYHTDLSRFARLYPRRKPVVNLYEFAEKLSGSRLLPWQVVACQALDKDKSFVFSLTGSHGKTWFYNMTKSYIASEAIGRFARWATERSKGEEGKTI